MEPSAFTIVERIKFKKSDIEAIKDTENGFVHTPKCFVPNIPFIRYQYAIFPNGNKEQHRGQTWLFLYFEFSADTKVECDVNFSFSSVGLSRNMKQTYGEPLGWGKYISATSTLFDPTKKFFVADQLVIQVHGIFKVTSPPRIAYPISVQWRFKEADLLALKDSKNGCIRSKVYRIPSDSRIDYFVTIFPNGDNDDRRGKAFIFSSAPIGVEAVIKFSIESANYSYFMQHTFKDNKGRGTFPCLTEDLFNPEKKFVVDGELTVKIVGTLLIKKEREPTIMKCEKGIVQKGYHRGRNFTIFVGEKSIRVHKHVLQAASSFFVGLFISGMKEAAEKKMTIVDFDYEVVHAAMKLLYSAAVPPSFNFEQMLSLLQFSDKYDIQLIKDLVQDYLIAKISPTNVCLIINFTTTTVIAKKLQQKCINFMVKRLKEQKAVNGLETLDKFILTKILLEVSTQNF